MTRSLSDKSVYDMFQLSRFINLHEDNSVDLVHQHISTDSLELLGA